MTQEHAAHARRFERLANASLDLATLPDQLLEALARAVPFDAFCWGAVDPASLLPTRATGTTIPCTSPLIWEVNELVARGVVPRDIRPRARSGRYVARLSEVVDAQSEHSPVYQRVLAPNGLAPAPRRARGRRHALGVTNPFCFPRQRGGKNFPTGGKKGYLAAS